jgi:hypothetical protein
MPNGRCKVHGGKSTDLHRISLEALVQALLTLGINHNTDSACVTGPALVT